MSDIKSIRFPQPVADEMVRAILEGRKTVTRRVVPEKVLDKYYDYDEWCDAVMPHDIPCTRSYEKDFFMQKAPYRPGDILYVRETWAAWSRTEGVTPTLYYKADRNAPNDIKWHPSIHMPKEAARLFLRVTAVRVERLQDMTEDDVFAEGAGPLCECPTEHTIYYPEGGMEICWNVLQCANCPIDKPYPELFGERVWDNTIKKSDLALYGWEANPWVWVIEFERIGKEAAQ